MSNYRTRSISYKPRMSDDEAYEKLGPKVRRALQEAIQPWSAYWAYREFQKHGADHVVDAIRRGDEQFCRRGFEPKKGFRKGMPSTLVECKVPILRGNW